MEYLALKKDILTHAIVWLGPEYIMFSERNWSQKDKYCTIPFITKSRELSNLWTKKREFYEK